MGSFGFGLDQGQFACTFQLADGKDDGVHRGFPVLLFHLSARLHLFPQALGQTLRDVGKDEFRSLGKVGFALRGGKRGDEDRLFDQAGDLGRVAGRQAGRDMHKGKDRAAHFGGKGGIFGQGARGLDGRLPRAVSQFGQPNGYILGEEASGAAFIGARYGEGTLYTRNQGDYPVFWQGPSVGLDVGGDGSKVMVLVYNLSTVNDVFGRFPGVDGSAYVVGGLGMTVMKNGDVVMVPIRSGVGLRAGVNVGYLKFTDEPTWNPF